MQFLDFSPILDKADERMSDSGKIEMNTGVFTWKLENFSKRCEKVSDCIESPMFINNDIDHLYYCLRLYPYGINKDSQDCLSLYLNKKSDKEVQVYYKCSIVDDKGADFKKLSIVHKFDSNNRSYGWPKFHLRSNLLEQKNSVLVDDILNIKCSIHMNVSNNIEVNFKERILDDYETLFLDGNLSDVTIIIMEEKNVMEKKNKQIDAHKSILSARSKVFAAMFKHNMKENNTNIIEISDVSYDIMKELLLFIYSGKVEDMQKNAKKLLPAAEKYEIIELKALCEESLFKNVQIEDACEILTIAHLHNCATLKTKIIDYIITNVKEINKKSYLKALNQSNPELFETIVDEIVKKKF